MGSKQNREAEGLESRLNAILEAFENQVPGVRGSAIADSSGLPVANGFREPFDLLSVASMSTMGMQSSKKIAQLIGMRPPQSIIIEGEDGKIVVLDLGAGKASFIAVVEPEANLGLLKLSMLSAAKRLEEELGMTTVPDQRVQEVFLLTRGGILISHVSRSLIHPKDRDVVGAMLTAVQEFVRESFSGEAGTLEELEMAHLRVRLIRGRHSILAFISPSRLQETYIGHAMRALEGFEALNATTLEKWSGDLGGLKGLDILIEEVLNGPARMS